MQVPAFGSIRADRTESSEFGQPLIYLGLFPERQEERQFSSRVVGNSDVRNSPVIWKIGRDLAIWDEIFANGAPPLLRREGFQARQSPAMNVSRLEPGEMVMM